MDKIVLNNGLEIEGATIARSIWTDRQISVNLPGKDIIEMAVLFGDKENTRKIEYVQSVYKIVYYGYLDVVTIGRNSDGNGVAVVLQGDENAHWEREYTIPSNFIPEVIAESINDEKENTVNGPGEQTDSN